MGWSIGYDDSWNRWIGYGVPAFCDHPDCDTKIDRGLAYVCCQQQPYGGEDGCGLYFCEKHRDWKGRCERCASLAILVCSDCDEEMEEGDDDLLACPGCEKTSPMPDAPLGWSPFDEKPEHPEWIAHVRDDESWAAWRSEEPDAFAKLLAQLPAKA